MVWITPLWANGPVALCAYFADFSGVSHAADLSGHSSGDAHVIAQSEHALRKGARSRSEVTLESETIMRNMARSWVALANQMDRLDERDQANAAHLALAR